MTNKLTELQAKLTLMNIDKQKEVDAIKADILVEYSKVFKADKELHKAIEDLDNFADKTTDYQLQEDGLYLWTRIDLSDYRDALEYLEVYLDELGSFHIDTENECLMTYLGDDFISIQDDTRSDNGVWQGHDIIIQESEYTICDDCKEQNCSEHRGSPEVCEQTRNKLIEQYMQKTGVFPAIGRVTQHGDFFTVDTRETKEL